ncbi:ATP-binding protein [Kitasatospora sp. NPDC056446]|uniref:ATP-binding protein n=1 Tax=Kitasatospora sp. NPDC056446 TaxID=3345819 RepID=UPI003677863D
MSASVSARSTDSSGGARIEIPEVRPGDLGSLLELPCDPESARPARRLVAAALTAWSAGELRDVAELLVSELVANAVRHTGCTRISVSVNRRKTSVWVGVRDSSRALPCRTEPKCEAESGYGLGLVETLSSCWGVAWAPRGKWVWFELRMAAP